METLKTEKYQEIQDGILLHEYEYYLQSGVKIKHGLFISYYLNGNKNIKETREYKHNKCDGLNTKYYESGEKLCEIEFKEDVENGLTQYYYQNGKLQMSVNRVNGIYEGTLRRYFPNDAIQIKQDFILGKLHGDHIEYDSGGNVLFHHKYENGFFIK